MLNLPGHTPGHRGLLVRLASGPVLLSGDIYHFTEQVQRRGVPTFNTSRAETLASMDRFDRLGRNLRAQGDHPARADRRREAARLPAVRAMKALLSNAPGGPETLELTELPDPVPAPASCSSG